MGSGQPQAAAFGGAGAQKILSAKLDRASVVLPAPLGPTIPTASPGMT
jgi:hypothetical protein